MKFTISIFVLLLAVMTNVWGQNPATDPDYFANVDKNGVILDGYDAVAFFTDSKPVKGSPSFQSNYKGAIYQFASAEHKQLFDSNPEKYKVQFGGWCAYAVALGRIAPIIIDSWSIVDGRLVVQHNERAVRGWKSDVAGNLVKADKYWAAVSKNKGKQIITDEEKAFLNNLNKAGVAIEGYDPVAYFKENKAVKGDSKFTARHEGADYYFSSEANQNAFKDNPNEFKPQYGSFCAYAVSRNKLRPIDPTIFQIVDGRLFLQHSQQAYDLYKKDLNNNVKLSDNLWPGLVKKRAGKTVKFDKPAK